MKKRICLKFLTVFFRIGLFTFGGGYAMVPLIHKEAVEKQHWISDEDILDLLAIAQSTPGPMAINTATYVGYKVAGFWGSLAATIGVTLPSMFIIVLISLFYKQFRANEWINYAFLGIRAGVAVLLLNATVKFAKALEMNLFNLFLLLSAFCAIVFFNFSTMLLIIFGIFCGIARHMWSVLKKGDGTK